MPVLFDYKCSDCDEVFEALTNNSDTMPVKCKACGSVSGTFEKQVNSILWIEGTTHGSKPIPLKKACNTPADMFR